MSRTKIELLTEQLESAKAETIRVANAVPESARLYQPAAGRPTAMWLVGHLGNTANVIMIRYILQGENAFPKEHVKLFAPDFAGGDAPTSDAAKYPAYDDVIKLYDTAMSAAIAGLGVLNDEDLDKPIPAAIPDQLRAFFPTIGKSLQRMVGHDSYHRGQIALLGKLGA